MRTPPEGRRLRPIRLSEIPYRVRQDAYDRIIVAEVTSDGLTARSFTERVELGIAATRPSDRTYWVSEEAYERAASKRAWKSAARREREAS